MLKIKVQNPVKKQYGTSVRQEGFVLITALLILLVLTILGISLFRGFGLEQKIAGNTREKTRARDAAESAIQYAEWWLQQGNNASTVPLCDISPSANSDQTTACLNNPTVVPWVVNGQQVGTPYTPPGFSIGGLSGGANEYYAAPQFYITEAGMAADGQGLIYRIYAVGYGGTPDAVAVLESTYELGTGVKNLGAE